MPDDNPGAADLGPRALPDPRVAFVTGATGFIAGRLVQELAKSSDFDRIHCLVRDPAQQGGLRPDTPLDLAARSLGRSMT